jgi:(p)ppGpp synthase/HD superfamily hydrolase
LKRLKVLADNQETGELRMNLLNKAIIIAAKMHDGQTDKGGQPYILHSMRVMQAATTEDESIVAVLHDLIEDTPHTINDLRNDGFPEHIIQAIDCLTRRNLETYEQFIDRIKINPLAVKVKRLDIADNMNLDRIPNPTKEDYERIEKYREALENLNGVSG